MFVKQFGRNFLADIACIAIYCKTRHSPITLLQCDLSIFISTDFLLWETMNSPFAMTTATTELLASSKARLHLYLRDAFGSD